MVNSNNVKTSAVATSNSSVNVDRPIVSQAIKNEPPILTKAPQLPPPPTQQLQQKTEPPPLQNSNNNPPPVISKAPAKNTRKIDVKPPVAQTPIASLSLKIPPTSKVKEEVKSAPPLNSQASQIQAKVKGTPTPTNAPAANPFGRAPSIPSAPAVTTPGSVPLSGMNDSKPPTLTAPSLNINSEKKEMPSLTPGTPVLSLTSPPNGKEKISFGMVDDSLIAKSMTPKPGMELLHKILSSFMLDGLLVESP